MTTKIYLIERRNVHLETITSVLRAYTNFNKANLYVYEMRKQFPQSEWSIKISELY